MKHTRMPFNTLAEIYRETRFLKRISRLLEALGSSDIHFLAIDHDGLVSRPLVIEELPILFLRWIQLGELVALVVWRNIERRQCFLSAHNKGALNDGIVGLSKDGGAAEDVFPGSFETCEESALELREPRPDTDRYLSHLPIKLVLIKVILSSSLYL